MVGLALIMTIMDQLHVTTVTELHTVASSSVQITGLKTCMR